MYKKLIFSQDNFEFFVKFLRILQNLPRSVKIFVKVCNFQAEICRICSRGDDFLVDFEECCKMRIWTRKSALIQPRTSLGKSDCVVANPSIQDHWMDPARPADQAQDARHRPAPGTQPARRGSRGCGPRLCWKIRSKKSGIFERKWSNFRELVLFCIEADFCNQILIF